MDKKFKKDAGRCPVCGKGLAKSKKELLDKLGFDTTQKLELSEKDIKDAFREKAKTCHPDKPNGSPNEFQEIKDAKEELLEMLRDEGSIPNDPLDIKPLEDIMTSQKPKTIQDVIRETPDPIQMYHIKQIVDKMRAQQKPGSACVFCKQK